MRSIAQFLLAAATSMSLAATAQEPPGRVGRVAFTEGSVAIYQDPDTGWEKAAVNAPVTSRNSLWTEPRSRAEMRVSSIALRLDETTQLDISRLDEDEVNAFVARGSLAVRVRHFDNNERLDFATPQAAFRLYGAGRYRIDVDPDGEETILTVFAGTASMRSSSGDVKVATGSAVHIYGGSSPSYVLERAVINGFDRWALARDDRWVERNSTRYVSYRMTGYEDLDQYGEWIQEPAYGALWIPTRVQRDWVPYRYGHWSYLRTWGWTWVDDQPWGYAPFHYGRWVRARDRWCWYPGQRDERPVWAPALVAWVGGSNWNVGVRSGFSSPAVGWYPLAPSERYNPTFTSNPGYVSRVNNIVINNVTVHNYGARRPAEDNLAQAVTVVSRDNMLARRSVAQSMLAVSAQAVRDAPSAPSQSIIPTTNELQRMRQERARTAPPSIAASPAALPVNAGDRSAAAVNPGRGDNPLQRGNQAIAPMMRPAFVQPQGAPAPALATTAPPQSQPQQQVQPPPPGSATNPLSRGRPEAPGAMREPQRREEQKIPQPQPQQQQVQPAPGGAVTNPFARGRPEAPEGVREQQRREGQQIPLQQQQLQQQQQQQQERAAKEAQQQQRAQQQQQLQHQKQRAAPPPQPPQQAQPKKPQDRAPDEKDKDQEKVKDNNDPAARGGQR